MDQDGNWHEGGLLGFSPGHIVLDRDAAPPPQKKGHSPQLSAHVYYGQTSVCIRMPPGTEVGLCLGGIALDVDPSAPPLKGHNPQFSPNVRCGQTAG